ncbi:hypothetical protein GL4_0354 [Methyloceanibacter caenitepidi]|uniref:Uncharacterized protein n=1 Tax=Methyloceanibacter caenitepidi TaxID=1384459 RepID=A0A0A8JYE3_9HYPH|nr:hypothetical protein GL4_0354 [Methyloceanibacter caenitepidi]
MRQVNVFSTRVGEELPFDTLWWALANPKALLVKLQGLF